MQELYEMMFVIGLENGGGVSEPPVSEDTRQMFDLGDQSFAMEPIIAE